MKKPCALLLLLLALSLPGFAASPRELTWEALIPADAAAAPPPVAMHDLAQLGDALSAESAPPVAQQRPSEPTVRELDSVSVKLPGYIVPLDVSEEGRVTEFLLVPYFGACIHVPPPPSNQIVHVKSENGVLLDTLYQPFWIEGTLKVEQSHSDLAESGYAMQAGKIYPYEIPDQ
ncbi:MULTISPECIES: DUF3299 domain-containing protein [Pseudomonas]|uniref:DUF3299 domain-containing protein n=1 Tax=Pseudomonas TaxID=286 RepID=UPI00257D2450|nr:MULTISPECIES: DUF3299 domain-containing protein [Pseudomonas]